MTLSVAVEDADNRPLEYVDAAGRPTGFHIELVRRVAAALGWQISFDRVPWQRAQALLEAGSVDAVTYLVRAPGREAYAVFLPDNRLSETGLDLWVLKSRLDEIRWQPPLSQMMGNYSRLSYAVVGVGQPPMISRMAWRADFPLSLPVAMTEAAAA